MTGWFRISVDASVDATLRARLHIDLVGADLRRTGPADEVPPIAVVHTPRIPQSGYRAYPWVDHIADKVGAVFVRAIFAWHGELEAMLQRQGGETARGPDARGGCDGSRPLYGPGP